jgi:hypothetical protein
MKKKCECEKVHEEKFVCDFCLDKAKEYVEMYKAGRKLFNFILSEKEINYIIKDDYCTNSKSGNQSIGKTIVFALQEGVYLPESRNTFLPEMLKTKVIKNLSENKRLGKSVRMSLGSNATHVAIFQTIRFIVGMRNLEKKIGKEMW